MSITLHQGEHHLAELFIKICMKNKSIYDQALWEVRQETVDQDWSSINAIAKFKRGQDSVDPYHIFKVNDKKWNGNLTFVMKSSRFSAETALQMDTHNRKTPMTECVVFMDGLNSRVKDYITLTLWVENPIICKMQRLACMECAKEDTENVTIFLQNFLAILCEVKQDPNYMWKPHMIMVDENGANKRAVDNVLGEDMRQRTVSCQWHFLRCAKKVLHDKVYICIKFVSLYVLYEIMWNTCVTLIYSFIMYILICTSRNLLQCCTSKCSVVQS